MAIDYKRCPYCGTKSNIRIVYGLPPGELYQDYLDGKIKLGGCVIEEGAPDYYCPICFNDWTKEQIDDGTYKLISKIKASVGGFFGNSYGVNINLINNKAIWNISMGPDAGESHRIVFNSEAKEKFLNLLKRSKLLEWKDSYVDPDILDGIQWNVRIIFEGEELYKHGSNKYPKRWKTFCMGVKKLVDREFH